MSRIFTKNIANYMSMGAGNIGPLFNGASVVSISLWIFPNSFGGSTIVDGDDVLTVWHSSTAACFGFRCNRSTGPTDDSGHISLRRLGTDGASVGNRCGATAIPTGQWTHIGGIMPMDGATFPDIYKNGLNDNSATGASAATSGTFLYQNSSPRDESIGMAAQVGSGPISITRQFDGYIAEVALWAGDIGASNISSLSKGFSPMKVRPDLLRNYYPLYGGSSPEQDIKGGKGAIIAGALPMGPHPRVFK